MKNKDKLKDWCLETFKYVKIKVTNGNEEIISKTNIKKINPTIYKIKSITILYYDNNYFKNKNYYIPKLKQEMNFEEIKEYLKGVI